MIQTIGNYFDIINRSSHVHLPMGLKLKAVEIRLFEISYCGINENPAPIEVLKSVRKSDVVGIPLSEDWLKMFGLIGLFETVSDKPGTFTYFGVPVKYVHELQNLHMALKGTELTIATSVNS